MKKCIKCTIDNIPKDFDFYTFVESTILKLCDIESKIQQLEYSEGRYLLIEQERNLLDILPCFSYSKY